MYGDDIVIVSLNVTNLQPLRNYVYMKIESRRRGHHTRKTCKNDAYNNEYTCKIKQ